MKLVSLNLWLGNLIGPALRFLQSEQADIMCLQEVYSSDLDYPIFVQFHSLETITAAFPDYHVYYSPVREFVLLGGRLQLGNAILSRFPIIHSETTFIHGSMSIHDNLVGLNTNNRNLQTVTLQQPSGSLSIMNHHGYWDKNPMGNEISAKKMQVVADHVVRSKQPLILAGDFNLKAESPALKSVQALLRDLTKEYRLSTTLSMFGKVADVACDHIFVSSEVRVKTFAASDALVSDHKALILEFNLPG